MLSTHASAKFYDNHANTILAATIGVMDAAFGLCSESYGHLQWTDRKVAFHPIGDLPSDDTPGMKV